MKRSNLFFIASIVFYVVFIIGFFLGINRMFDTVWLCLGSVFLALGYSEKKKEDGHK